MNTKPSGRVFLICWQCNRHIRASCAPAASHTLTHTHTLRQLSDDLIWVMSQYPVFLSASAHMRDGNSRHQAGVVFFSVVCPSSIVCVR